LGDASGRAFSLVAALRRAGISTDRSVDGRGAKGAMKAADRSGARIALILGDRDLEQGVVQMKDLVTGQQTPVAFDDVLTVVSAALEGRDSA
jgi:histidyl-tRNA synthetase